MSPQLGDVGELFESARGCLDRECRRTNAEIEAFDAFERRLHRIQPDAQAARGVPAVQSLTSASANGLRTVRTAYESTVMDVPHYDEEYDDTYERSVREEFGPNIAGFLTGGAAFEERQKQALLSAVSESRDERRALSKALAIEADSLTTAIGEIDPIAEELLDYDTLEPSEMSFGALDAHRARLDVLEEKCTAALKGRQAGLVRQRRDLHLPIAGPDVATYVYQGLPVRYPTLAGVAIAVDRIDAIRIAFERTLISKL